MILSAQFRPRLMAALHVFAYAHGSSTPSSTLEPHHPPPHEFRARTYFRVVLYLCASIKPIPTPTLLHTSSPYDGVSPRRYTRLCARDTERRLSLPANCH